MLAGLAVREYFSFAEVSVDVTVGLYAYGFPASPTRTGEAAALRVSLTIGTKNDIEAGELRNRESPFDETDIW